MRLRILGVFVATILLLAACASTGVRGPRPGVANAEIRKAISEDRVVLGMTADQVRGLWGQPNDVAVKASEGDVMIWTYERKKAIAGTVGKHGARAVIHRTIHTLTFKNRILMTLEEKAF